MGAGFKDNTTQEAMQKIYPLGMLEAEDVADTIIFLLSDMSKKITGQSIWLSAGNDGGSIDGHNIIDNKEEKKMNLQRKTGID